MRALIRAEGKRGGKKFDVVGHFDTPSSSQQPLTSYCLGNKQTHSTVLHSSAAGQRLIRPFVAQNGDGVANLTFVKTFLGAHLSGGTCSLRLVKSAVSNLPPKPPEGVERNDDTQSR